MGRSAKRTGSLAGSSTQRVCATPDPSGPSVAETDRCTGETSHPWLPLGLVGVRTIVVTGASASVLAGGVVTPEPLG